MNVILIAVIILGVVGLVASIMLYAASKKFAVVEDERIGQVAEVLVRRRLPRWWTSQSSSMATRSARRRMSTPAQC